MSGPLLVLLLVHSWHMDATQCQRISSRTLHLCVYVSTMSVAVCGSAAASPHAVTSCHQRHFYVAHRQAGCARGGALEVLSVAAPAASQR